MPLISRIRVLVCRFFLSGEGMTCESKGCESPITETINQSSPEWDDMRLVAASCHPFEAYSRRANDQVLVVS